MKDQARSNFRRRLKDAHREQNPSVGGRSPRGLATMRRMERTTWNLQMGISCMWERKGRNVWIRRVACKPRVITTV